MAVVHMALGAASLGLAGLLDIARPQAVGVYAGSLTNTPALAAARALLDPADAGEPVVGYALAYPFGVLGFLLAVVVAGRSAAAPPRSEESNRLQAVARLMTSCWICSVPSKMSWIISGCPPGCAQYC